MNAIHFIQAACLADYSSGTASHFLSKCSTCSISKQQNGDKKREGGGRQSKDWIEKNKKNQTQNDKKHEHSEAPYSPATHVWQFPAINHKKYSK